MSAAGTLHHPKHTMTWQVLLCLVVVSFLCRALIPPGYMPTPGGRDAVPTLELCDGGDNGIMNRLGVRAHSPGDDAAQSPAPLDHGDHSQHPCPFCVAAAQAVLPGHIALAVSAACTACRLILVPLAQTSFIGATPGSPLGSRAPPRSNV